MSQHKIFHGQIQKPCHCEIWDHFTRSHTYHTDHLVEIKLVGVSYKIYKNTAFRVLIHYVLHMILPNMFVLLEEYARLTVAFPNLQLLPYAILQCSATPTTYFIDKTKTSTFFSSPVNKVKEPAVSPS